MIRRLIKSYIQDLVPYSTARDEFEGTALVYLDANENPYLSDVNRYPDPHQRVLKQTISKLKGVAPERIFIGNGSDEAIDLLVRIIDTGRGGVTITSPTYGMYRVTAANNGLSVIDAPLTPDFDLDIAAIRVADAAGSRLLFICSPNNPTGRQYKLEEIIRVLDTFSGLVVVDEAYIDFARGDSALELLSSYERLVVLQTFSKAWGLAGLRLGMAFADPLIIESMNKLKLPYNVSELSQRYALGRITQRARVEQEVGEILSERASVAERLLKVQGVEKVFPSEANFLLVRVSDAKRVFESLRECGVIVRDRSKELHCQGCLRITIGTPAENQVMLHVLEGCYE